MENKALLRLGPIRPEDMDAVAALLCCDEVKQTYMVPELTQEEAQKLARRFSDLSRAESRYVRGIYLEDTLIGFLNDTEITENSMELGWVVHPAYRNRGYATCAVAAAVRELFDKGFEEVCAGAFSENPASIRVMEKVGMALLDKKEVIAYRGKEHECVFYSIRKIK